jgi:DNA repair protein RadA/Sms
MVEERAEPRHVRAASPTRAVPLMDVPLDQERRFSSGLSALDALLGGGLVPGSLVLVGGEPGIGKSTLVTQAAMRVAAEAPVLYVSAEESPKQLKMRVERLGEAPAHLLVTSENIVEAVSPLLADVRLAIVDSIQTVRSEALETASGSVGQVRECAAMLQRLAKETDTATFLVGHVTKEGAIAGPRVLEHLVDVVLYFEGEPSGAYRVLRAVKNRFGATDEVALFEMGESGLRHVENPSSALLAERVAGAPGSAVAPVMEGTRCLLAEVQALCTPSFLNNPRRVVTGIDFNRMTILLAVMEKRLGLRMGAQDVFVNVAGGLRVVEPAADLPALLAAASSLNSQGLPADLVAFGEVGLGGEIRSVAHADRRLKEAAGLGFQTAVIAKSQAVSDDAGAQLIRARDVGEAVAAMPASAR